MRGGGLPLSCRRICRYNDIYLRSGNHPTPDAVGRFSLFAIFLSGYIRFYLNVKGDTYDPWFYFSARPLDAQDGALDRPVHGGDLAGAIRPLRARAGHALDGERGGHRLLAHQRRPDP